MIASASNVEAICPRCSHRVRSSVQLATDCAALLEILETAAPGERHVLARVVERHVNAELTGEHADCTYPLSLAQFAAALALPGASSERL